MKEFNIGNRTFQTIESAVGYYSEILNRVELGKPLEGPDAEAVGDLFGCHPDKIEKLAGQELSYLTAGRKECQYHKHRCFYAHLSEGGRVSFGIRKAVSEAAKNTAAEDQHCQVGSPLTTAKRKAS